jgi:HK97 family phage portal protein
MSWNRSTGYYGYRYGGDGGDGTGRPGLRDRIASLFSGREVKEAPQPVVIDRALPAAAWSDRTAKAFFREGYKLNSAVFSVTRTLANGFAEPPLLCYEDETKKKALPTHPVRKLITRPNEIMGEDEFWRYWITYASTSGNAYGQLVPSLAGNPVELWPWSDLVMSPVAVGARWVDHYNYSLDGIHFREVQANEITHFKWAVDPEAPYKGMGALHPVARETDTDNELTRYLKAILQNDAMPRTLLIPGEGVMLTKQQKEEVKREFAAKFGADNMGAVGVMDRNVTVARMSLNMEELAFDAIRAVPEARIASAYGVPAIVAGLNIGLARSTYSNYEEARKAFTEQTLVPLWKAVASEIQQSVVSVMGNDCYVDFDLTQVKALSESKDKKAIWVVQAVGKAILTVNEARAELGYEPVTGGDVLVEAVPEPTTEDDPTATDGGDAALEGDSLEMKEFGKKQAAIEKDMRARVESYLLERSDEIAAHVEA